MNREDFEILKSGIIYFDNGATTFKPNYVIDKVIEYYEDYTANAHRGDYANSIKVDEAYESVRTKVKQFINAASNKEIVFTKGTTNSLNMIVFGFMKNYLKKDDEVIITRSEHASNILPWLELEKSIGIKVRYIDLDENLEVTIPNLEKVISDKTKVISLAHITNVVGDVRPIEEIGEICKKKNILFVVDAAQSIGHIKTDVNKYNIDFLGFSAHKMLGPTGVGVLYGKEKLLNDLKPIEYGGGMNVSFDSFGNIEYKDLPSRLEAGTPNISGVIGLGAAIDYINSIGLDKIHSYEINLKKYALDKLSNIKDIEIYNTNSYSGIITFNLKDIFPQDTALFLDYYNICVRAGNHCTKALKEELGIKNTCRISFYLYNNQEEIDKLIEVLNKKDKLYEVII